MLRYVDDVTGGRVSLSAMAAANVVGPCVAEKLSREGLRVVTCSGADTAAWRRATGVAKSHAVDAACAAMRGTPVAYRCAAPVRIEMTGRGRRLVVRRNGAGFPALRKMAHPSQGTATELRTGCAQAMSCASTSLGSADAGASLS